MQLEEKGKQFERSAKSDKAAADIKYKGNRRQLEVNLGLDNILAQIDGSTDSQADIHQLVAEGKQIIKERQKLIKIADKNKDGWLVVQEYESNDLASALKMRRRLANLKLPLRRNEKKQRVTAVTLRKNLLVICSFFAVRTLFICTL